ncbi:unnamed protein product [Meloidogyne enterolobii]|uniref:Uncharacterized protein n=1 Tax=Meloidogyne enterolobii TaxID=390850 RepID=A0ACB0YRB9_MELEN
MMTRVAVFESGRRFESIFRAGPTESFSGQNRCPIRSFGSDRAGNHIVDFHFAFLQVRFPNVSLFVFRQILPLLSFRLFLSHFVFRIFIDFCFRISYFAYF